MMTRASTTMGQVSIPVSLWLKHAASLYDYSGTPLKGHPWIKDISLIRTFDQVPTSYKIPPWNEDSSLIRTHFIGPRVSVLERFHCIFLYVNDLSIYFLNYNYWQFVLSSKELRFPFVHVCSLVVYHVVRVNSRVLDSSKIVRDEEGSCGHIVAFVYHI